MTIASNALIPADYLSVADTSFSSTCLGHALDTLLNLSKEKRVDGEDLSCLREGIASLSICLADLHRDKFFHLHTEDDEADALTMLHSLTKLVQWIEYKDRDIGYLLEHPNMV